MPLEGVVQYPFFLLDLVRLFFYGLIRLVVFATATNALCEDSFDSDT